MLQVGVVSCIRYGRPTPCGSRMGYCVWLVRDPVDFQSNSYDYLGTLHVELMFDVKQDEQSVCAQRQRMACFSRQIYCLLIMTTILYIQSTHNSQRVHDRHMYKRIPNLIPTAMSSSVRH